jgi:drug/metabolite transporter (DMT)-like permease
LAPYRAGILFVLGSVLMISCADAVAKLLAGPFPAMQIALFQSTAMLISVPLLAGDWRLIQLAKTNHPGLHALRSLCMLGSALSFFTGLKYLPLAEIVAIIFIGPLLVTILAALILKEHVELRRWVACITGFLGAVIIVRPGFGSFGWTALYPIAATSLYSVYVICTRVTAPTERHSTMMFYTCVASVVILSVSSPLYWVEPPFLGWVGLTTVALLSTTSASLAIKAYSLAPASVLAPYAYVEIVTATLFGFWLFGDLPIPYTVAGTAIVVASGLYIFHRERSSETVIR